MYSAALSSLGFLGFCYQEDGIEGYSSIYDVPYGAEVYATAYIYHPDTDVGALTFCSVHNEQKEVLLSYSSQEEFLKHWTILNDNHQYGEVQCKLIPIPIQN